MQPETSGSQETFGDPRSASSLERKPAATGAMTRAARRARNLALASAIAAATPLAAAGPGGAVMVANSIGAVAAAAVLGAGAVPKWLACQYGIAAERAGKAFLDAAKSGSARAFASALAAHTDRQRITLFALGKYRSQLPPHRRSRLVSLTSRYVSTTLAEFAAKFRASSITTFEYQKGHVVSRLELLGGRPAERSNGASAATKSSTLMFRTSGSPSCCATTKSR